MSEAGESAASSDRSRLAELTRAAEQLGRVQRQSQMCAEFVRQLDKLLVPVARGRGAIDIAIGERLDALSVGDRSMDLSFASVGDYAREKLGIAASTGEKMARFARALRDRPLLREAVRSGEVSVRQAEAVLPVAHGEAEAHWVARARCETVRALKAAVNRGGELEEEFKRVQFGVAAEKRPIVEEALAVAGEALGATVPKWQRLRAFCEEYLSDHAGPEESPGGDSGCELPVAPPDDVDEEFLAYAKRWLEQETERWSFLTQLEPVAVTEPSEDGHASPRELDADLRRLGELRSRWDEVFGHLAMLFVRVQGWRFLKFASLDHYAEERLGMSGRAVEQRAWLERRLEHLGSLRQALRERRLSYEQARVIGRYAEDAEVGAWIRRAADMTCVELRIALQDDEERKMCARGEFSAVVPVTVRSLLRQAFDAVRKAEGRWLPPGECLARIAEHFVGIWKPLLAQRSTLQKQVLERDGGRCQVPGCSRAALHAHHIVFRSAGGRDVPENLVSLCPAHHLRGVHMGRIRVTGTAPDGLRWELGVSSGLPPFWVVEPRAMRS